MRGDVAGAHGPDQPRREQLTAPHDHLAARSAPRAARPHGTHSLGVVSAGARVVAATAVVGVVLKITARR